MKRLYIFVCEGNKERSGNEGIFWNRLWCEEVRKNINNSNGNKQTRQRHTMHGARLPKTYRIILGLNVSEMHTDWSRECSQKRSRKHSRNSKVC